jgi:hypothetical protein
VSLGRAVAARVAFWWDLTDMYQKRFEQFREPQSRKLFVHGRETAGSGVVDVVRVPASLATLSVMLNTTALT